jgi:hypothetical protein
MYRAKSKTGSVSIRARVKEKNMMGLWDKLPVGVVQNALQVAEMVREQATLLGKDALKELDRLKERVKTNAETVSGQVEGVRSLLKEQAKEGSAEVKRRWHQACEYWGVECKESIEVKTPVANPRSKEKAKARTETKAKSKAKTKINADAKIDAKAAVPSKPRGAPKKKKNNSNPASGETI